MRILRCSAGETIAESLVTFLIAVISAVVLGTTMLSSAKVNSLGDEMNARIANEENDIQKFLIDGSGDCEITEGTLTIKSNGIEYARINIVEAKTEINEIFAYKKE